MKQTLKLKFVTESTAIDPDRVRTTKLIEGADASDVLEQWRTSVSPAGFSWEIYEPSDFRKRIVDFSGAEVELPAEDDEILDAVVAALGPDVVQLERSASTSIASLARKLLSKQ